jgi:hypothetical protein
MVHCNHNAATIVESTEVNDEGLFVEIYECPCGARGRITGDEAEPPRNWKKIGRVFND